MRVVVVDPPRPIAEPSDIPGQHAGDDPFVTLMLRAAQDHIDGPPGWLGRSLGVQTLELTGASWPEFLPFGPIISIESVSYVDMDGATQTLPPNALDTPSALPATKAVTIRYRTGYDAPPANARAAVVLLALGLMASGEVGGGLRSFEVQGAFTKQFNSPELMARVRTQAVESLLQPLRVYR